LSVQADGDVNGLAIGSGGDGAATGHATIRGDEIHLARVTPSIENMNDVAKYEFFAGHDTSGTSMN
jgi:hypothetical protein